MGQNGSIPVLVVQLAEFPPGNVFVVKDLDDLQAIDHFLHIAVDGTQGRLLAHEVYTAFAADDLDDAHHGKEEAHRHQRQQRVEPNHHTQHTHKLQHAGDEACKAVVDDFADSFNIVGETAHQIAVGIGVEILQRQRLQLVKQILSQGGHGLLGYVDHNTGIGEGTQGAHCIDSTHQHQHFQKARKIAGDNVVIDNGLHQVAAHNAAGGTDHQAKSHQDQPVLLLADVTHQTAKGDLQVLGALEAVTVRAAAGRTTAGRATGSASFLLFSHPEHLLPAGTGTHPDKSRCLPSVLRGCPHR